MNTTLWARVGPTTAQERVSDGASDYLLGRWYVDRCFQSSLGKCLEIHASLLQLELLAPVRVRRDDRWASTTVLGRFCTGAVRVGDLV
jgi:hypothetical protein